MIFNECELKDSFIIEPEKLEDERGFFSRTFDKKIFEQKGLETNWVQHALSFNKTKGTLRGMHFQLHPYQEAKFLRCVRGSAFEVMIDLRKDSTTYKQWVGIELSAENYKMIYVPEGFALGFQALEDNTELAYQVSQWYTPEYESGIRYDDPAFKIEWPLEVTVISERDLSHPPFKE